MRSLLFNIFFVVTTLAYAIVCVIFSLLPGRKLMMASLRRYTRVCPLSRAIILKSFFF